MAIAASDALLERDLKRAKTLAANARYEEALDLLERHLEGLLPAEAAQLVNELRQRLEPQYRRRISPRAVLQKSMGTEALRKHRLSAKHAFLWSLCGDGTSVEDLLSLSPLHPLDSLRTIARLVELGLLVERC